MFVNQTQVQADLGYLCCDESQMINSSYQDRLDSILLPSAPDLHRNNTAYNIVCRIL